MDPREQSPSYKGKAVVGFAPMPKTKFQLEAERVRQEAKDLTNGTYETSSDEFGYRLKVTHVAGRFTAEMTQLDDRLLCSMNLEGTWGSNAYYQAFSAFMWQFEISLQGWVPPPVG